LAAQRTGIRARHRAPRRTEFLRTVEFLSANLLMPLSALLVSVFLGWRIDAGCPQAS